MRRVGLLLEAGNLRAALVACFRLSMCRVENQTGPLFDCQMALFLFDKNKLASQMALHAWIQVPGTYG